MLGAFQATSKPWLVDRVPDDFAFSLLDPDWEHFAAPLAAGRGRLPRLDALGIETFVNGPEGFTPDGNPLVGAVPGVAGLYVSAGFNSSGIAYGGGVGEALAQWIEAGEQPFDMWALDVRRFGPAQARREFLRARGVEVLGTHMRLAYPGIEWSEGRDLNRSALHGRLAAAGASFGEKLGVERANWFSRNGTELRYSFGRPSWFADSAAEHAATRTAAGLFDVSSFAKLRVTGPGAPALLQRACAGDVDVAPGKVVYTAMLTARGTFASDLTVIRGERRLHGDHRHGASRGRPRVAGGPARRGRGAHGRDRRDRRARLDGPGVRGTSCSRSPTPTSRSPRSRSPPRRRSTSRACAAALCGSPMSASSAGSSMCRAATPAACTTRCTPRVA